MNEPIRYRRLEPAPGELGAAEALAELRAQRERVPARRPYVYASMISTADGRATIDGGSHGIGSPADGEMLSELRVAADAVLVAPGTLGRERYRRPVRAAERVARRQAAGLPASPLVATLTRSGRIPWNAPLFADEEARVVVLGPAGEPPPRTRAQVTVVERASAPAAALAHLRGALGVRLLMCEGGPSLNAALLGAGLVDELFLTLAPILAGDRRAPTIVQGPPLRPPLALERVWTLAAGDELFLRFRVVSRGPSGPAALTARHAASRARR